MTDTPEAVRLADELAQLASEGAALIHLQSGAYICQKFAEAASLLRRIPELETARDVAVELAAQYAAERDQLRAELEKVRVPDGWKLVPVDATQVMRDAGNKTLRTLATEPGMGIADRAFYVWCAMLTAAPTPPHADQKGQ